MKIISATQSRKLDLETIKQESIPSIDLMERASKKLYKSILKNFGKKHTYNILCGNGNNGGDELVIARYLFKKGCPVNVFIDFYSKEKTEENTLNLAKIKNLDIKNFDFEKLKESENNIWIDAIFGAGLNRPLKRKWSKITKYRTF